MDDTASELEKVHKRVDRIDRRVFDELGPRMDKAEKLVRGLTHRSALWERAADAVLTGGPDSLVQTAASNKLAIRQLTHDVTRLLTALEAEKGRVDMRATLLGLVLALVVFDTLAIVLLIIAHLMIYGGS